MREAILGYGTLILQKLRRNSRACARDLRPSTRHESGVASLAHAGTDTRGGATGHVMPLSCSVVDRSGVGECVSCVRVSRSLEHFLEEC